MKKYVTIAAVALLLPVLTGCENTEYERGRLTQRGNEIYYAWTTEMSKLNHVVHHYTFGLNQLLQATPDEAESIYDQYFTGENSLTQHAENVYQIRNRQMDWQEMADISFLVLTDGKDLNEAGASWTIVLNVPNDYEYEPVVIQKMTAEPPYPPQTDGRISCGEPYLPFTIQCTAPDTWTWKDVHADGESLEYFSVDCTVKKERKEIVPGLVTETQYRYTGAGRLCVERDKQAYIDYETSDLLLATDHRAVPDWVDGRVDLTVSRDDEDEEIRVGVDVRPRGYTISYRGITEEYPY